MLEYYEKLKFMIHSYCNEKNVRYIYNIDLMGREPGIRFVFMKDFNTSGVCIKLEAINSDEAVKYFMVNIIKEIEKMLEGCNG